MKRYIDNLHLCQPLRKGTNFRYLPQIALVPFKTRMTRFIDESKARTKGQDDLKWPNSTYGRK